jgi:hypothetical protein
MTHEPLSERIENECNAAARNREPVLLVGTDRSLLERVAHRIHMLSPARLDRNLEERRKQYVSQSCVGEALSPEWANGPRELSEGQNVLSPLEIFIAENDTVHLSDVESSAQLVQRYLVTRIHASEYDVRLIFSSIIDPTGWREEMFPGTDPFLMALRRCFRIDVTDPASGPATGSIGLTVMQDDDGRWIFQLDSKQYPPVNGKADGFRYLKILCDSPDKEFSPKELRDRLKPDRTSPKRADTDRGRVRNAVDLVMDPKKNIPSEVRSHLNKRDGRLKIGTVCVYHSVPE